MIVRLELRLKMDFIVVLKIRESVRRKYGGREGCGAFRLKRDWLLKRVKRRIVSGEGSEREKENLAI